MTTDSEKSHKINRLSRREFIKGGLLTALGAYIDANTHVVTNIFSSLNRGAREVGLAAEGNPVQVSLTAKKLIDNCLFENDPAKKERAEKVFIAWIKFNAASHYPSSNESLAAQFAGHFLYGEGQMVDISEVAEDAIVKRINELEPKSLEKMGISASLSARQKLKKIFEGVFGAGTNASQNEFSVLSKDNNSKFLKTLDNSDTLLVGSNLEKLEGKKVNIFRVLNGYQVPLLHRALGKFTLSAVGSVASASAEEFSLRDVTVKILDTYDFNRGSMNEQESVNVYETYDDQYGATTKVEEAIRLLGLRKLIPDELFNSIKDIKIKIHDQEGALLQQEKLAHAFKVQASYVFSEMHMKGGSFGLPVEAEVGEPMQYKIDFLSDTDGHMGQTKKKSPLSRIGIKS